MEPVGGEERLEQHDGRRRRGAGKVRQPWRVGTLVLARPQSSAFVGCQQRLELGWSDAQRLRERGRPGFEEIPRIRGPLPEGRLGG